MFALTIAGAQAVATIPDTCLTPAAPSPVPIPYPNMATTAAADPGGIVEKVLISAAPALNQMTKILLSNGDQGGTAGGGVVSHMIMGEVAFVNGSMKVMIGGKPGVRLSCMTMHNKENTTGLVASPSQATVMLMS
ncbi:DUF4150 domain-containing protein [Pollutimonas harenae]|uniref:DUF4150 domain-containing protein n=1 Tax=Pollutimonas harenae TaxID=657015 RepID=A0A853GWL0_9BURK|nr:DUF4150 domain-containing protein [Pollutimonas harenae]NYT85136.1 DUF4150 domain-containing protein [Pollutimonas harenae]TEA72482.1 DUF4150 domain-containing protein [Pollutimonas harenae]